MGATLSAKSSGAFIQFVYTCIALHSIPYMIYSTIWTRYVIIILVTLRGRCFIHRRSYKNGDGAEWRRATSYPRSQTFLFERLLSIICNVQFFIIPVSSVVKAWQTVKQSINFRFHSNKYTDTIQFRKKLVAKLSNRCSTEDERE